MQPIGGDTVTTYFNAVLDLFQEQAYFSDPIQNWDVLRQKAQIMIANAKKTTDTHRAIQMVLESTGYPRTCFVSPEEAADQNHQERQTYGFCLLPEDGSIAYVLPHSPASDVGLQPGDKIIGVDYHPLEDVEKLPDLLNPKGPLRLILERPSTRERLITVIPARPAATPALPVGQLMGYMGYIEVSELLTPKHGMAYIQAMHHLIGSMNEEQTIKGWVLDLRRNTGDCFELLLAAIQPFLGDGDFGQFTRRNGSSHHWRFRNNAVYIGDKEVATFSTDDRLLNLADFPVALLTSSQTRNAAEMLLVAFSGRANTRRFGEATYGSPTYNKQFPLSDGALLTLTTAIPTDRTGKQFVDSIEPDEVVAVDWINFGDDQDPVIHAALSWLKSPAATTP